MAEGVEASNEHRYQEIRRASSPKHAPDRVLCYVEMLKYVLPFQCLHLQQNEALSGAPTLHVAAEQR